MHDISLKLEARTATGKKVAAIRHDGFVPSVVYGGNGDPQSTQSAVVETIKAVNAAGKHTPVHLTIDGKKQLAIIKSIDIDPVKRNIIHLAFHAIKQNDVITTSVPIVLTGEGESAAEKAGLVILQAIESIEVKAKPANLPESLEISIVDLATDEDKVTVGDITLPKGVEFADVEQDLELVIANVYEPAALEAANEAAAGTATDPVDVTSDNGEAPAEEPEATEKA